MELIDRATLGREIPLKVCLPCPMGEDFECKDCLLDKAMGIIEAAPAIDAVPVVHGRWKDYPDCGVTVCSACGWSIEECFYDPTTLKPYPYCPNCGALMDGERRE